MKNQKINTNFREALLNRYPVYSRRDIISARIRVVTHRDG